MHIRVTERVNDLPNSVWDCEACNSDNAMQIRRSSLNEQFMADDVTLKCSECRRIRSHGIPFSDPEQFRQELKERGRRVLDFAQDDSGDPVKERLDALGYIAKGESL